MEPLSPKQHCGKLNIQLHPHYLLMRSRKGLSVKNLPLLRSLLPVYRVPEYQKLHQIPITVEVYWSSPSFEGKLIAELDVVCTPRL